MYSIYILFTKIFSDFKWLIELQKKWFKLNKSEKVDSLTQINDLSFKSKEYIVNLTFLKAYRFMDKV